MKALLRAPLMVLVVFAIFAAFSCTSNEAFGIGPKPTSCPPLHVTANLDNAK
jgi:hypothetical protein